jgi:rubrerythrin
MDFIDSQTFLNLKKAFESELITSSNYAIYARKAREDGYIEIGNTFEVLSHFEIEHATTWLKILNNGGLPDTSQNLKQSYEAERTDAEKYQEYATVARDEGYHEIGALFDGVANIEMNHDTILNNYEEDIEQNTLFCKNSSPLWICTVCGNIIGGVCAPVVCPICGVSQNYYQVYNYEI